MQALDQMITLKHAVGLQKTSLPWVPPLPDNVSTAAEGTPARQGPSGKGLGGLVKGLL